MSAALVPQGMAPARLPGLLGCTAEQVVMRRGRRGKPLLTEPAGAACSVAHRAGVSLVAAGWHRAIGVDLELVRADLPLDEIADTCFTAAEAEWLRALPERQRAPAFAIVWAVKEAVLKATGQGIADGMADPAVPAGAVVPLLAGAASADLHLAAVDRVHIRQGMIGPAHAIACLAVIA